MSRKSFGGPDRLLSTTPKRSPASQSAHISENSLFTMGGAKQPERDNTVNKSQQSPSARAKRSSSPWVRSEAEKALKERATKVYTRKHVIRLRINILGVILLTWLLHTDWYTRIEFFLEKAKVPPVAIESIHIIVYVMLFYNIIEAIWSMLKKPKDIDYLSQTPDVKRSKGTLSGSRSQINSPPRNTSPSRYRSISRQDLMNEFSTPVRNQSIFSPGSISRPPTTPLSVRSIRRSTAGDMIDIRELDSMLNQGRKSPGVDGDSPFATPLRNTENDNNFATPTPRLPIAGMGFSQFGGGPDSSLSTPLQQRLTSMPEFSVYHTATPLRRTMGPGDSSKTRKSQPIGNQEYLDPDEVIHQFGIAADLPAFIENMRKWFTKHILRPLQKQVEEMDDLLQNNNMGQLACTQATSNDPVSLLYSQPPQPPQQTTTSLFGLGSSINTQQLSNPTSLEDLAKNYPNGQITKQRLSLECYLSIPGYDNFRIRGYVLNRISELSRGGVLSDYSWDSGTRSSGTFQWKESTHPPDSQLLFHFFCTFMDQCMPLSQKMNQVFTKKYVAIFGDNLETNLPIKIVQVSKRNPHFSILSKNVFYDTASGRNNLFITLVLFVLKIKQDCAGYLNLVNLDSKQINLLSVVDDSNN
ncbi:hypothetical protein H4219_000447 [Mycoemilia scoparia]|uniref:Transmembrane protein 209 n=1 Tax=Mycoemilia scoparia TaxID=417184 RepID=A0A9W8A6X2_9FUNG|nr:hypothetical protein H4219_000447 [Mycoemilia scoparia]